MKAVDAALKSILPVTAAVNDAGHLAIGGCDAVELVQRFDTPLYVFDEETLRGRCRELQSEFQRRYPDTLVIYACKAYIGRGLAAILAEEGLGADIVTGGELGILASVGFPADRIYFHGNNKSPKEIWEALEYGVHRIVVDNFHELQLLNQLAGDMGKRQQITLRVSPDVDPHTHDKTTTGVLDSKFGIPITTGQAEMAVRLAQEASNLELVGLHCHLGSPIFELEPYAEAIDIIFAFAHRMTAQHGLQLREFSPGGGFAVQYLEEQPAPSIAEYAEAIVSAVQKSAQDYELPLPSLVIEPGRSVVAQAGVALYTVGASKDIPGLRRYVSVDGGMADNIRPALYGSRYSALVANKLSDPRRERVTVAGKYCESGDMLLKDIELPPLEPGDVIAMPAAGAYAPSMASNYNAALKPAIVLVKDGQARLLRRRETYEDLTRCDVWPLE
ncbi:MAG TPA: diaminopimelate decarboxylase [Dehalococcoidia bacterium]|nr:diaminopimelate decarboxylase [Dehalococcoidia bacterium]